MPTLKHILLICMNNIIQFYFVLYFLNVIKIYEWFIFLMDKIFLLTFKQTKNQGTVI